MRETIEAMYGLIKNHIDADRIIELNDLVEKHWGYLQDAAEWGEIQKRAGAVHNEPPQHWEGVYESKAPNVPNFNIGILHRWFSF